MEQSLSFHASPGRTVLVSVNCKSAAAASSIHLVNVGPRPALQIPGVLLRCTQHDRAKFGEEICTSKLRSARQDFSGAKGIRKKVEFGHKDFEKAFLTETELHIVSFQVV